MTKDPFTIAGKSKSVRNAIARSVHRSKQERAAEPVQRIRASVGGKPPEEAPRLLPHPERPPNIMLDSGAFSAWYRSESIDIGAYIEWLKQHREMFYSHVCLDVIPGDKGRHAKSASIVEEAAEQSYKNFRIMTKAGLDPIPVFHMGEDWKHLERLLDERVPYIGISPYMKASQDNIIRWMDECFTRLTTKDGVPLCKTHGFGVTGHRIVRRYPWFSVDSTSWALSAGYGNILMPAMKSMTEFDFAQPLQFSISERDTAGNNSLLHLGDHHRQYVDAYFATLGLTFTEVRNFQEARLRVNAGYYMGLERQLEPKMRFRHRIVPFPARPISQAAVKHDWRARIILATMVKIQQQGVVLTQQGVRNRLISYYDCRRFDESYLREYTTYGYCERGAFNYKRGTDSYNFRRRMLLLKRLNTNQSETE